MRTNWLSPNPFNANPRGPFQSLTQVKEANRKSGSNFFERETMEFFNSNVESILIGGRYFVTSERMELSHPKLFTIREAQADGDIDTVGKFRGYDTKRAAVAEAKRLAK